VYKQVLDPVIGWEPVARSRDGRDRAAAVDLGPVLDGAV